MPYLFDHYNSIRELLSIKPLGLFTDFDGTISEIVSSPEEAQISSVCRDCLAVLTKRIALVGAVSGRAATEVKRKVGIDEMVYIGNHGLDRWVDGRIELVSRAEPYPAQIEVALGELKALVSDNGIIFENKGATASIHYRRCDNPEATRSNILSALKKVSGIDNLNISQEKMAIGLRPPIDASKGTAVLSFVEEYNLKGVVYLGDDLTDVDVFTAIHGKDELFRGIAIGVVGREIIPQIEQEADFTLNGVSDVERLLKQVVVDVAGKTAL